MFTLTPRESRFGDGENAWGDPLPTPSWKKCINEFEALPLLMEGCNIHGEYETLREAPDGGLYLKIMKYGSPNPWAIISGGGRRHWDLVPVSWEDVSQGMEGSCGAPLPKTLAEFKDKCQTHRVGHSLNAIAHYAEERSELA